MTAQTKKDREPIEYPDSDGMPMAENTLQFKWIVVLKDNLEDLYRADVNVFVAGDLLWYPVEGKPTVRMAPDAMVVFGRPKGYRGSYKQWEEGGIAPQVVFEVLSPGNPGPFAVSHWARRFAVSPRMTANRPAPNLPSLKQQTALPGNRPQEMAGKLAFYEKYGVEEYYVYDPDAVELTAWRRHGKKLRPVFPGKSWTSPLLGIRFDLSGIEMVVYRPDGQPFLTFLELKELEEKAQEEARAARRQAASAKRQATLAQRKADKAEREAADAHQRAERLAARLRELGIDPEAGC